MSAIDFVKRHPVAIGFGAVVVFVGFVLLSGSGGGESTTVVGSTGPSDAEVAAGMQLQQLQYASQSQNAQVAAQREVALASTAASLELGKLELAYRGNADNLAASTALAQINAQKETMALTSTLQAQTSQAQIAADSAKTAAMMSTITEQARAQAQTAMAAIQAQVQIAQINKPKQGLFSMIFG